MGLWIPIILMCSAPYIESCKVITGLQLVTTKEQCFKESIEKANTAVKLPQVYKAQPLCQKVPEVILEEESDKIDL